MKGIFIPDCTQDEIAEILMYARIGANNSMIGVHKHYISVEDTELPRWIPVSERLPDERDWYLGLFKEPDTGFIGIPYICDYVGEITKGTTKEGWILRHCTDVDNASDYFRNLICVAWQPLPEPYEPKEKENG